jgi:hypothetical protein
MRPAANLDGAPTSIIIKFLRRTECVVLVDGPRTDLEMRSAIAEANSTRCHSVSPPYSIGKPAFT